MTDITVLLCQTNQPKAQSPMSETAVIPGAVRPPTRPLVRAKLARLALMLAPVLLLASACAGGALSEDALATVAVAQQNQGQLNLSDDLASTELLDGNSGAITSLGAVVTGDRPILVWYWAPD
jgi:hypothetical protein